MNTWYLISVFIHVLCGAFWIGGMLFLPLVILPGIKHHPDRISILYKSGIKYRFYGWIALLGLMLSGLLNIHLKGFPLTWAFFTKNYYGNLVSYKIIFFICILLISALHDLFIGKKAIEEMQQSDNNEFKLFARWSGRINLILSLIIAFLGVALSRGGF